MVEVILADRYPFHKKASGLGEPDAACIAVEQGYAKFFLKGSDPCADAGLAGAERLAAR
jgi:hypothetical protein